MDPFTETRPNHKNPFSGKIEATGDGKYVGVASNGEAYLLKFIQTEGAEPTMFNLILGEDEIQCLSYLLNDHLAGRQPGS